MNIGYTGEVTIATGSIRYTRHNMGTDSLFKLLSAIFGRRDSFTNKDLPGLLMIYDEDIEDVASSTVSSIKDKEILNTAVNINFYSESITDGEKTSYQTVFTTYLTTRNILKMPTKEVLTIALLDENGSNVLAAMPLDKNTGIMDSIMQGNQAMVKWVMKFSNV